MSKKIALTRGLFATVDDDVFPELNKHKWYANKMSKTYYAIRNSKVKGENSIYMHRQIMGFPSELIDHENRNGLDNTRDNLSLSNKSKNAKNTGKYKNNKSGYKGVSWDKSRNKWQATKSINGKNKYLGRFDSKELARDAYLKK